MRTFSGTAARRLVAALAAASVLSVQATGVGPFEPSACDHEWERIKSISPMSKTEYADWLKRSPAKGIYGSALESEADYYYFLARVPSVIGIDNVPSMEQREDWLQKAANQGHKAAKAALMRLRYLGFLPVEQRSRWMDYVAPLKVTATRTDYLKAAREAAEAGDPEFATVMMDTAQNINRNLHCHANDTKKIDPSKDAHYYQKCDPQDVTQPIETKKWAEVAARGGNPNAKVILCKGRAAWPQLDLGFSDNAQDRFAWCFAAENTACLAGAHHIGLEDMYERGIGTPKNPEKAEYYRKLHPRPINAHKLLVFPLLTR